MPSLDEIRPVVLEKKILNISNIILHFCYNYFPLEIGVAFHLNKHEFPLPKNVLCQVWLKLAQWFWRRRFLNIFNIISHFPYYLPLEKVVGFHLNKLESLPKNALCQFLFKLAKRFWRRSRKCENLLVNHYT